MERVHGYRPSRAHNDNLLAFADLLQLETIDNRLQILHATFYFA